MTDSTPFTKMRVSDIYTRGLCMRPDVVILKFDPNTRTQFRVTAIECIEKLPDEYKQLHSNSPEPLYLCSGYPEWGYDEIRGDSELDVYSPPIVLDRATITFMLDAFDLRAGSKILPPDDVIAFADNRWQIARQRRLTREIALIRRWKRYRAIYTPYPSYGLPRKRNGYQRITALIKVMYMEDVLEYLPSGLRITYNAG